MSVLRLSQTWRTMSQAWRPRLYSRWYSGRALRGPGGGQTLEKHLLLPTRVAVGGRCHTCLPLTPGVWLSVSSVARGEVRTVSAPQFAESVSEGDVRWEKSVGEYVAEDEVIAEIETDKTALQVPSPVSGVLEEQLVADGDTVTAGMELARIRVTGEGETEATPPVVETTPTAVSTPIPTSPPPPPPLPSQPMATSTPPPPPPPPPPGPTQAGLPGPRTEHRVKMNRMRLRIAERLKEAQNTNAMLTTFNEVDMSNVIVMRQEWKNAFQEKHGVKLGFMSPFVKAACHALLHQPIVNAVIDGTDILYRDYVDISVAVATPKGLVVPVLRSVETMNYADIEKTITHLGEKARDGTLAIEDMDGGTFTISNGGVFGSLNGTPIINPPQSAILGMHATVDRPVAIQGKVEVRPMMYIALTYDHRLIDGREAVFFLKKIKQTVEDPRVLLLDL